MKKIAIRIEESKKIEQIEYLYISSLNILTYLLKQSNANNKYINNYFKKTEYYYIYYELLKNAILHKYKLKKIKYYYFDFNNNILVYEE